jgi:hypothetical protein
VSPETQSDRRETSRLLGLSQIGLEMVAPIGLGLALDYWLGWLPSVPWLTITGAVLGPTFGLIHLVRVMNRENAAEAARTQRREAP